MKTKHSFLLRFAASALASVIILGSASICAKADETDETSAELPAIWADGDPTVDSPDRNALDAVKWLANNERGRTVTNVGMNTAASYYLLMPSTADLSALTIWHTFDSDPVINGTPIKNGEVTNAINGAGEYTMTIGDNDVKLTVMKSENTGAMYISTETGSMNKVHSDKSVKESGEILVVEADGTQDYSGSLDYIKGRGSTTWRLSKRPYNIKLDKKAPLLGMGESKKWCLLANAQDHSMLRNKIAYDLADEIGLPYSPDSGYVDLYLNGNYAGVYQLTEKVEEGKNNLVKIRDLKSETEKVNDKSLDSYTRVDGGVDKGAKSYYNIPNDPEDITGGYLLECDVSSKYIDEDSGFVTNRGQCVVVKGPENASKAQIDYISSFVQDMEDAIYSYNGVNSKGKHYSEYLDEESAALMYLIEEYALNIDAGSSSCFFFKDSDAVGDGKIHAAPVWDFDVSFGNLDTNFDGTHTLDDPTAIYVEKRHNWEMGDVAVFGALCSHRDFNELVMKVYKEKFRPALDVLFGESDKQCDRLRSYDEYKTTLEPAANMNFIRWRITDNLLVSKAGRNFEKQTAYLDQFLRDRAAFFDTYFAPKEPGDELNVYFYNYDLGDHVYVYWYDETSEVEYPGVEMTPLGIVDVPKLYKIDLGKYGVKDDGLVQVVFTNGSDKISPAVRVKNHTSVYYTEYTYYDEDGKEYTGKFTDTTEFNESDLIERHYLLGDVDRDDEVTSTDALKILRFTVQLEQFESYYEYLSAMIDSDQDATSADALYVLRYSVGMKDEAVRNYNDNTIGQKVTLLFLEDPDQLDP